MTSSPSKSMPDMGDRHRRLLALAVLAMAVRYTAMTAGHLTGPAWELPLDLAQAGGALLALGLLLPAFLWKRRRVSKADLHLYFNPDGVVAATLNRAHIASWGATFLLLMALDIASRNANLPSLPAPFYLQLALAVMLGVFGVVFLVLDRSPTRLDHLDSLDASGASMGDSPRG